MSSHLAPYGASGFHDILKNEVDDVFLKDAEIAVFVDVFLEGFQLQARLVGDIANPDGAEVGQSRLGTHGGEFGNIDLNLVAGKLIGPAFYRWKLMIQPASGVVWSVAEAGCARSGASFPGSHPAILAD